MVLNTRFIFSKLCVLLVLFLGPVKAYGLALCQSCEEDSSIEAGEAHGSCTSSPYEDSSNHHDITPNESCTCIDKPLNSHELTLHRIKNGFQKARILPLVSIGVFRLPFQSKITHVVSFVSTACPPSLAGVKSVVLLI